MKSRAKPQNPGFILYTRFQSLAVRTISAEKFGLVDKRAVEMAPQTLRYKNYGNTILNIEKLLSACSCCAAGIASTDPLPCGELPPQRLRGLEIGGTQKILSLSDLDFLYGAQQLWGLKGASSPFFMGPAR